jgi:hypothetical protein
MKSQKLSHQLFQSKTGDSAVCSTVSSVFSSAEGSATGIGVDSDSTQFPLTIWASVQFSAWAETGRPTTERIVRRVPAMNACFLLGIFGVLPLKKIKIVIQIHPLIIIANVPMKIVRNALSGLYLIFKIAKCNQ